MQPGHQGPERRPLRHLAASDIGSSAFALRTLDNMMGTLWLMALLEFDAPAQDDIVRLARSVRIASFTRMVDELLYLARERDLSAEGWMADKPLQAPGGVRAAPSKADCHPEPPAGPVSGREP